jgi:hypothetical protein
MMFCKYCNHEIDMDSWGWSYSLLEYQVVYWHCECFQEAELVAIA